MKGFFFTYTGWALMERIVCQLPNIFKDDFTSLNSVVIFICILLITFIISQKYTIILKIKELSY